MKPDAPLRKKFALVWRMLDERTRRLMAASEALTLPYGGVSRVHRACGLSRNVIAKGIREIQSGTVLDVGRVRRPGAGRKPITVHDPQQLTALDRLIEPDTRGDPESPLRWVCKSTRVLAAELARQRHRISHVKLAQLLHQQHYSLQGTRKNRGGRGPSRSRRAVPAYQCQRQEGLGRRPPGAVGRYQEEGARRELRQRRPPMAPGE